MSYLNIDEVESGLAALAAAYPAVTELIRLPYATYEGRITHALRIGVDSVHDGVLFTACAHAREWAAPRSACTSPPICSRRTRSAQG